MVRVNNPGDSVGYGRPPKQSQFQPGSSGNRKGRPKGSLNLATLLERELRERVVINESGRRRTISKLEAAIKQLVNKAATGDLVALKLLNTLVASVEEQAQFKLRFSRRNPTTTNMSISFGLVNCIFREGSMG